MGSKREIQERGIAFVVIASLITLGIYTIYWSVVTRRDLVSRGGDIPTAWLIIIPFANIYFDYKYSKAAAKLFKKEGDWGVYFILFILISWVAVAVAQNEFNRMGKRKG